MLAWLAVHALAGPGLTPRRSLMLRFLPATALFVWLSLGGAIPAQELPEPNAVGSGARAIGLGYATTAAANDVFAIGWNPAGLGLVRRREVGVSVRGLLSWSGVDVTPGPDPRQPELRGIGELAMAIDPVEFAGAAYPMRLGGRRVVAGLAWRRFTEGVRIVQYRTRLTAGRGRFAMTTTTESSGGIRALSPSLAVEVSPRLFVGMTADILHGTSRHRIVGPRAYTVAANMVQPLDEFRERRTESGYSGLAVSVGALVDAFPGTRLGVTLTLPHDRHVTLTTDSSRRGATFETPLEGALGARWTLNDHSSLFGDLRFAGWSGAVMRDDSLGTGIAWSNPKQDSRSLHLGYEREVFDHPFRRAFRAGGFLRRTTAVDVRGNGITLVGLTAGDTWQFARSSADFGLVASMSSRWTRSATHQSTTKVRNREILLSAAIRRTR